MNLVAGITLISVPRAAEIAQCSQTMIRKAIRSGALRALPVKGRGGRHTRWAIWEVDVIRFRRAKELSGFFPKPCNDHDRSED